MSFSTVIGSSDLLALLGGAEAAMDVTGSTLLLDLKKKSALLPMPTEPSHANYPPVMPCRFFSYGRTFNVKHTFRTKNPRAKNPVEIEMFTIEVERDLSYYKRQRVLRLCQEAISNYLGDSYFGRAYEVKMELVPKLFTKKELKRINAFREQLLKICSK